MTEDWPVTEDVPEQEQIVQTCQELVDRYRWQFLTAQRLAARVAQLLAAPMPPPGVALPLLCKQAAGVELHTALQTPATKAPALEDLSRYLTALAVRLPPPRPDVSWDDLVQDTLIEINQKPGACRVPAALLAWAVAILKRKGGATWRTRPAISLEALAESAHPAQPDPSLSRDRHVDPLGDQELLQILHDCLETDEERAWALWICLGLKRREWAMIFDSPLTHFDWLRVRVQRKLRQCPRFLVLMDRAPGGGATECGCRSKGRAQRK